MNVHKLWLRQKNVRLQTGYQTSEDIINMYSVIVPHSADSLGPVTYIYPSVGPEWSHCFESNDLKMFVDGVLLAASTR
jgi:hypothetical protein